MFLKNLDFFFEYFFWATCAHPSFGMTMTQAIWGLVLEATNSYFYPRGGPSYTQYMRMCHLTGMVW